MMKLFILMIACLSSHAATWYVGSSGSSTNGTYLLPWGPQYAVTNSNPHLQPGDLVLFKPGTYVCVETNGSLSIAQEIEFRKSGTASSKITYRPMSLWQFSFDGGILIPTGTSNIIVERFRLFDSNIANRVSTNYSDHPNGFTDFGTNNAILHNLIENTGHPGIGSWKTTQGKYIAGNIIRFIGYDDWSIGYSGANRGSGMYLQNADNTSEALIQGNISYYNYTTGMKAYGNTDIWRFHFANQICAENAEAGLFYHLDNYGSTNLIVRSNYLWQNGSGIRIGYPLGNSGHSNAIVQNNYVVDNGSSSYPLYLVDGWSNTTWSNNVAVSLVDRYPWYLEVSGETGGNTASHHIDFNTYYATNVGGFGTKPFFIKDTGYTLSEWQAAIQGETNSSFSYSTPASNSVFVFRPSTDSNFVHVAVFNWTNATTTSVDLSSYFSNGARLSIYDAQNIPTAYANITYAGGTVPLNLTLTNRATMVGTFSQRSEAWSGFDTRFRAFVIYKHDPMTMTAVTATAGTLIAQ